MKRKIKFDSQFTIRGTKRKRIYGYSSDQARRIAIQDIQNENKNTQEWRSTFNLPIPYILMKPKVALKNIFPPEFI